MNYLGDYSKLASAEAIEQAKQALEANGLTVMVAETGDEAKLETLKLIPEGSEVFTMTSTTLDTIGLAQEVNNVESGKYQSVRNQLNGMNHEKQGREMRKLGAAPDYAIGSVHAVTRDGKVFIASNTGSQLPAYAYGAGKVIWIAGTQKIVADRDEAIKRIYDYVLPLESERAHKAYGVPGSAVNKLLAVNKENQAGRLTLILVKQQLGF
jgi:YkgG family uncharacterized protein